MEKQHPAEDPQPLHELIASDQYWAPDTDVREVPDLTRHPIWSYLVDGFSGAPMFAIDQTYTNMLEQGVMARTLEAGEILKPVDPGSLLKLVRDYRAYPKKEIRGREYNDHELFDKRAQAIVDKPLYNDTFALTRVDSPDGTVDIGRMTYYLKSTVSERTLAGKQSSLLGRGGHSMYNATFLKYGTVGHIDRWETRKEKIASRIVRAEILAPEGTRLDSWRYRRLGKTALGTGATDAYSVSA